MQSRLNGFTTLFYYFVLLNLLFHVIQLGVLFLPTTVQGHGSVFSCTANGKLEQGERVPPKNGDTFKSKLVTLCWKENGRVALSTEAVQLPIPYQLPPQPYTHEDVPWSWDRRYTKKDVYGHVWP
ncbi:putative phosphodiesterase I [Dioscorea sansibarensis]